MASNDDSAAPADVAVIGLGYVGLTLAAALVDVGVRVVGVEANAAVAEAIRAGCPPFFEPGLAEILATAPTGRFTVRTTVPDALPRAVVVCVGTPVDPASHEPALANFDAAIDAVARGVGQDTLVVVRSTAPIGTARERVLPRLRERVPDPLLAVCPERTIQGRALAELRELPQVIGAIDERSRRRADELFALLTERRVAVSRPEAAEMVKLVNNAHTDVIYGFGNEVAVMAGALGLDADEVIEAANTGYPRPDLRRPGFVGGSCLTKDPYLLMHSLAPTGVRPPLIAAARALNEAVPGTIVDLVTTTLAGNGRPLADAKILVCGMAYKGTPVTDDVRGAASIPVAEALAGHVATLAGHDFLVPDDRIAALGYQPTSLEDGLIDADALVLLVDHPGYAELELSTVVSRMRPPPVIFDMWGLLRSGFEDSDKVTYLRWGRG
jgi:UDP-N-acetyl-D-mannosaminuronic acid dehydrogenase